MVWAMIAKMFIAAAPYIILGLILAGALHQWVPNNLLRRHLGGGGASQRVEKRGFANVREADYPGFEAHWVAPDRVRERL